MNKLVKICIPQTVKKRKYDVDISALQTVLRDHKKKQKLTNKNIAEILDKPITLVEHWFRTDNCFAIPDEDIWYELKDLLQISTDEFDKSITVFEYQDGVFESAERCYFAFGVAPTITSANSDNKIIVMENENE